MLFEVVYGLSDRAPEVDIIGLFKDCFYQILPWLINRVATACKHLKGKGTYRQNFNKVEPKTRHCLYYWYGSVYSLSKWWSLSLPRILLDFIFFLL